MGTLQQIAVFLVDTLLTLYIAAVVIRFLLAWARADFYNPLSQLLVKITNPILVPLRRIVPPLGKIDSAAVILAVLLIMIKTTLLLVLQGGNIPGLFLIWYAFIELLKLVIWIYIIAMLLLAVMSWVGNSHGNPMASLLSSLTRPILNPIRKVMPNTGMLDLSPMVATIGLYVVLIILQGLI
jgi:YggT family protein